MRKTSIFAVIALAAVVLGGCGSETTTIKDDDSTAETQTTVSGTETTATDKSNDGSEAETPEESAKETDDIWTYYNDATWSDDFNGVVTTIEKVVVTDKVPAEGDVENLTASAVGVKMSIKNNTDKIFTTYPDQAELVTSTGEQVTANMLYSDHLGGEIDEGVLKEGNVIWFLDRGNAENIEWIKMKWYITEGDGFGENDQRKEYEVKLQLK